MVYLITSIILYASMLVYFKIANHYNIIDKPNHRSAHTEITFHGGGIIFPIAYLFFIGYQVFFNNYKFSLDISSVPNYWIFGAGSVLICLISFLDDMATLSAKVRLVFHFISVSFLLCFINAFQLLPIWLIPILYVLIIGILNAFNFMDGINGITGCYSIVVLGTLFYVNMYLVNFTDKDFIIFPILASAVFLFFNFRKKAKCFMGDVGSLGIAFWIVALLGLLITKTKEIKYILFLAVYGIDAIATILERLKLRENIFEPHRKHLYQLLVNEKKQSHLVISLIYTLIQLLINSFIILSHEKLVVIFCVVLLPTSVFYILIKSHIKKQILNTL